jgi:hypothetical protein
MMESGGMGNQKMKKNNKKNMQKEKEKEMYKVDEELDSMSPFDVPLRLRATQRRGGQSPTQEELSSTSHCNHGLILSKFCFIPN